MSEYIHTTSEPTVIGRFDHIRAQQYADTYTDLATSQRPYASSGVETSNLLEEFDTEFMGLSKTQEKSFIWDAHSFVEHTPRSIAEPGDDSNLFHIDTHVDEHNNFFHLIPVAIGSSNHPTEIICGDVVFDGDITNPDGYSRYVTSNLGQNAIRSALMRGDAWIYEADVDSQPIEGVILQFTQANLHRRRQEKASQPLRFVVRRQGQPLEA